MCVVCDCSHVNYGMRGHFCIAFKVCCFKCFPFEWGKIRIRMNNLVLTILYSATHTHTNSSAHQIKNSIQVLGALIRSNETQSMKKKSNISCLYWCTKIENALNSPMNEFHLAILEALPIMREVLTRVTAKRHHYSMHAISIFWTNFIGFWFVAHLERRHTPRWNGFGRKFKRKFTSSSKRSELPKIENHSRRK